jgi:hypothetical protein
MLRRVLPLTFLATCSALVSTAVADDWPQFQGKNRDSLSAEKGLMKSWPESGPQLLWTFGDAGEGYSSAAVVGEQIFITGSRKDQETLICIDATKGKEVWATPIEPKFDFKGNQWGAGPRATPTVSGGMVVALGGSGQLICVKAADGKLVWKKHMMDDLGGEVNPIGGGPGGRPGEKKIGWGYSWSPLVDGNNVICFPGGPKGAAVALDLKTGNEVWRSKEFVEQASYASPILVELAGTKQVVFLHNAGLTSINPANGNTLWVWEKPNGYSDVVIPTPNVVNGLLYVSVASSTQPCDLVQVTKNGDKFEATSQYKGKPQRVMKNSVGGSVVVAGHAYGYSEKTWVCQEVASGKQAWAARQPLKAGVAISAEGLLFCYDEENGEVALVEANPNEFTLRSKFALPQKTKLQSPSGKNWTPLTLSNGRLFVRDQELLFCYKVNE